MLAWEKRLLTKCKTLKIIKGAFTYYVFWLSWEFLYLSEETKDLKFFHSFQTQYAELRQKW